MSNVDINLAKGHSLVAVCKSLYIAFPFNLVSFFAEEKFL